VSDGGIFAVGHAGVFTSTGSLAPNNRVVGMPPVLPTLQIG